MKYIYFLFAWIQIVYSSKYENNCSLPSEGLFYLNSNCLLQSDLNLSGPLNISCRDEFCMVHIQNNSIYMNYNLTVFNVQFNGFYGQENPKEYWSDNAYFVRLYEMEHNNTIVNYTYECNNTYYNYIQELARNNRQLYFGITFEDTID